MYKSAEEIAYQTLEKLAGRPIEEALMMMRGPSQRMPSEIMENARMALKSVADNPTHSNTYGIARPHLDDLTTAASTDEALRKALQEGKGDLREALVGRKGRVNRIAFSAEPGRGPQAGVSYPHQRQDLMDSAEAGMTTQALKGRRQDLEHYFKPGKGGWRGSRENQDLVRQFMGIDDLTEGAAALY